MRNSRKVLQIWS